LRVGEGFAEEERIAAPVGDGVAMNAGLSRGVSHIHAVCQGVDDLQLLWCENFIEHSKHFLIPA
jgi:hypothetical protein